MYWLYRAAILEAKLPVYKKGQTKALDYLVEHSNFTRVDCRIFLYILSELAASGDIDVKWWNIDLQSKKGAITSIKSVSTTIDKWRKTAQWGSIAVLSVVGLYLAWPYITAYRRKK